MIAYYCRKFITYLANLCWWMRFRVGLVEGVMPYTDGLVQGCSISIANALEILQPCTKPSIHRCVWSMATDIDRSITYGRSLDSDQCHLMHMFLCNSFMWHAIAHPCLNLNGDLSGTPVLMFSIDVVFTFSTSKSEYIITYACPDFPRYLHSELRAWLNDNIPQFHVDVISHPW